MPSYNELQKCPLYFCFLEKRVRLTLLLPNSFVKTTGKCQAWMFIGRSGAEAPILWPPDEMSWLVGKDPDAGKDGRREEKGTTEDEMVGWHHRLNGHEFESTLGVGDGQGGLVCCSPWGHKELDTTEQLNWTELSANDNLSILVELQFLHHLLPLSWKKKKSLGTAGILPQVTNENSQIILLAFLFHEYGFKNQTLQRQPSIRKKESEVAQSCPTLWDPTDCSLPGSSIHGIFQARILEWSGLPFPSP